MFDAVFFWTRQRRLLGGLHLADVESAKRDIEAAGQIQL